MFGKLKILGAALVVASPIVAASPAVAQARAVGVVSVDGAIQATNAYRNAMTQIQSTYASQIAAAQARATALEAELQPLQQALQTAQQAPGATQESVRPAYEALATRQQAAQQEMANLNRPVLLAREYVREQIAVQVTEALNAAMTAANVDLVLNPEAVLTIAPNSPANLTSAVTAQLNSRVSSVQVTPPENWQPGDTLRAAQQAAAPAANQQPEGR